MPPYNPLFGHLLEVQSVLSKIPSDAHPLYLPDQLRRKYPNMGRVFYLDMWPFSTPILFAESPSAAYQLIQEHQHPKADPVLKFMYPLTKNKDLVTMEGQPWKDWRAVLNPGFSASHLIKLVPRLLKAVHTYSDILAEHAQAKDMFFLERITIGMTMDIIGIVTLYAKPETVRLKSLLTITRDTHFNAQRSDNDFVSALREQILWLPAGSQLNPLQRLNPLRPFAQWYYNRRMDRYLSREIDNYFTSLRELDHKSEPSDDKPNAIISLALDKYLEKQPAPASVSTLDASFKQSAIYQMKGLILAGHGTTSNTLCFIYHLLSTNPSSLQRIREEHNDVLGSDTDKTSSVIIERPHILNQLPYTLAVIKESLRLYPADSSPRRGDIGFSLTADDGQYPTEGCMVWTVHQALHRDPQYWPQPDSFIPERWLTTENDPLHPVKGAWRPFEFGPRNCIGQELSVLEMKLALVMTIRKFDFSARFEEWDEIHRRSGPKSVNGERAYHSLDGTSRPRNGFPCRVTLRG